MCRVKFEPAQPFKSFNISGSSRTILRTGVLIETFEATWCCQERAVHERFRVRQLGDREVLAVNFARREAQWCSCGETTSSAFVDTWNQSLRWTLHEREVIAAALCMTTSQGTP